MIDYKAIGKRICYYRKKAGMTQEHLAVALSVTASYISQIERGVAVVSLKRLDEIATLIGTPLQSLVADVNESDQAYLHAEIVERFKSLTPSEKNLLLEVTDVFKSYKHSPE